MNTNIKLDIPNSWQKLLGAEILRVGQPANFALTFDLKADLVFSEKANAAASENNSLASATSEDKGTLENTFRVEKVEVWNHCWFFSIHPQWARLGWFTPHPAQKAKSHFLLWMRTHICNGVIQAIGWLDAAVFQMHIRHQDVHYILIWEAYLPQPNLLLLDTNQRLLTAWLNPNRPHRPLTVGDQYTLPQGKCLNLQNSHLLDCAASLSDPQSQTALKFWLSETGQDLESRLKIQLKSLQRYRKRLQKRLQNQQHDLQEAQQWETWSQWGELLKPQIHKIPSQAESVEAVDYFDPDLKTINIPLHKELSAKANLERYFRKAEKLKLALPKIHQRISMSAKELLDLETLTQSLAHIEDAQSLKNWEQALPKALQSETRQQSATTQRSPQTQSAQQSQQAKATQSSQQGIWRTSSDGLLIGVGRNDRENDWLTFRQAKGNDWWLHIQGAPGSHVIVRAAGGNLPQKTLHEAAQLALYYSSQRQSVSWEVDYTQRKYVRKIKGAALGKVTYSQNRSLHITLDDELIKALLANTIES